MIIVPEQIATVINKHNLAIPTAVTAIPHTTYTSFFNTVGMLRNVGEMKSGCIGNEFLLLVMLPRKQTGEGERDEVPCFTEPDLDLDRSCELVLCKGKPRRLGRMTHRGESTGDGPNDNY